MTLQFAATDGATEPTDPIDLHYADPATTPTTGEALEFSAVPLQLDAAGETVQAKVQRDLATPANLQTAINESVSRQFLAQVDDEINPTLFSDLVLVHPAGGSGVSLLSPVWSDISALQMSDGSQNARISAVEAVNNTQQTEITTNYNTNQTQATEISVNAAGVATNLAKNTEQDAVIASKYPMFSPAIDSLYDANESGTYTYYDGVSHYNIFVTKGENDVITQLIMPNNNNPDYRYNFFTRTRTADGTWGRLIRLLNDVDLDGIETKNTEQDTAINNAQSTADGAVSVNATQQTAIDNLESIDHTKYARTDIDETFEQSVKVDDTITTHWLRCQDGAVGAYNHLNFRTSFHNYHVNLKCHPDDEVCIDALYWNRGTGNTAEFADQHFGRTFLHHTPTGSGATSSVAINSSGELVKYPSWTPANTPAFDCSNIRVQRSGDSVTISGVAVCLVNDSINWSSNGYPILPLDNIPSYLLGGEGAGSSYYRGFYSGEAFTYSDFNDTQLNIRIATAFGWPISRSVGEKLYITSTYPII